MDMPVQHDAPLTRTDRDVADRGEAEWSAAVFGRNEAPFIPGCIRALARAGAGRDLHVTVLLNGTTDGSAAAASAALREAGLRGRVFAISQADKANAFNQFVHALRPRAETGFFVDAYAEVAPDALYRLAAGLRAHPAAQAAAAVPSTGRSADALRRRMRVEPGLHGSLFALRGGFLDRIAAAGVRLPIGLYRGDGLVGSLVMHDLDAAHGGWRNERLLVEEGATWWAPRLSPLRWRDLRRQWHRLVQQGRGRLQWAALKDSLYAADGRGGFPAMPHNADRLVLEWIACAPAVREPRPWRDPFAAMALRRMRRAAPWGDLTPRLVSDTEAA
ncbi:glycosyltransferase [Pararoseomonas indoligenes]|uniref:Glycosyltransferase n=1 Tax=Roseomonas indoligenes TaxID=2820811 RepID=A0A940N3J3_9PROT|nr:glycosyltransferase [Pararoseomonas indoligenes]MBP0496110.1 glycosyltransferase [Pararoseomonas indoligenes]